MAQPQRIVIIGSGIAGASAAGSLRERGYAGELAIIGSEQHLPYELPKLSKGILTGADEEPDWVHDAEFYGTHDITLHSQTTAARVRLGERTVLDEAGGQHRYDRLLIATGSAPRTLHIAGAELGGIVTLRTLDDSLALRDALRAAPRVVVVGAGWIGCEVASAARGHGCEVTVIDPLPLPLHPTLGDTIAPVFRELHAANGVTWRLGESVVEFTGADGRVSGVRVGDGTVLPADLVVVGVGAAPRVDLAKAAGLELADPAEGGGIDADAALHTSAVDVFAAGDVAAHFHPRYGRRVRVEHWANAKDQGLHVAGSMLGDTEPYLASPFFFSDQYDLGMEVRGLAAPFNDELVVRGELDSREFIAIWLREGKVSAAMNVNMWDDGDALQSLVDNRAQVPVDALRTAELSSLV